MDHITSLVASLEEGNPVPISLSLSHTGASSLAGFVSGACHVPSDELFKDTFVSEDQSDHDELIALGPCSDDSYISPADVHHLGFEASFSGSPCQLDINFRSLVDKNDSISVDDFCCADASTHRFKPKH